MFSKTTNLFMKKKHLLLCCILIFQIKIVFSATPYFKNYSVEDGLPYIQINALLRDSNGFLWTGGYGGLSKFDGKYFQNFSPAQGLVNYTVTSIVQGKKNEIIIGTVKGISIYSEGKFTNITKKNGLINQYINELKIGDNNEILAATRGGIFVKNKNSSIFITKKDGLPSDTILCLARLNKDYWFAGTERGFSIVSLDNKKIIKNFYQNQNNSVSEIFFDKKTNSLTLIVNDFLYELSFNPKKLQILSNKRIPVDEKVNSFTYGNNSTLWVATDNGVFNVNGKNIQQYIPGNTYNSSLISCLILDEENIIWLGTYEGLFKYKSNGFLMYGAKDGISNTFIYQIQKDKKNNLIVTSGGGGIFISRNNLNFENVNSANGLIDEFVWCSSIAADNTIWLGTNKGVCTLKDKKISVPNIPQIKNKNIFSILIEDENTMWFGGRGYVYKCEKNKQPIKYNLKQDNGDCDVSCIYKDKNGTIWLGAYQGSLYKFENENFIDFGKKYNLESESFLSIAEDKDGTIYFGSFDGIFILNKNKIDKINVKDGLSSNLVYSLLHDPRGGLWVGTNQGLSYFDLIEYKLYKRKVIRKFGKADGFTGGECNTGGLFLDENKNLYVGTVNGLIKFNPDLYKTNKFFPKTHITNLSVFYRDTILREKMKFNYNQNNLRFSFIGLSFSNPEKILYSYKLQGFDKQWSPPSPENFAKYSNLPSGKFTLLVKSCNDERIWTPTPVSFSFEILRPFWKKWWFILACVGAISIVILLLTKRRINKIKLIEREKLKDQIEKSTNELKALRAQMNPHFIFNSLNSIQHFVITHEENSAVKYLGKFSKLIRKILNNSEEEFISLQEELSTLELYLELEQLRFQNKFTYEIILSKDLETDFIKIPSMIIQPYVENAIIHGLSSLTKNGILKIEFSSINNLLHCTIDDNGIGIIKSQQKAENNSLHISLAGKISRDRLYLLKNIYGENVSVEIIDKQTIGSTGTRVNLILPIQ